MDLNLICKVLASENMGNPPVFPATKDHKKNNEKVAVEAFGLHPFTEI